MAVDWEIYRSPVFFHRQQQKRFRLKKNTPARPLYYIPHLIHNRPYMCVCVAFLPPVRWLLPTCFEYSRDHIDLKRLCLSNNHMHARFGKKGNSIQIIQCWFDSRIYYATFLRKFVPSPVCIKVTITKKRGQGVSYVRVPNLGGINRNNNTKRIFLYIT